MFEDVKINIVGLVNWSFQRSPPIASLLPRLTFFAHDSVLWLLRHCEAVQQTS